MTNLRAIIEAERQRRSMTITALAEAAGTSRGHLSRWLSGAKAYIRSDTLEDLMGALGLKVKR